MHLNASLIKQMQLLWAQETYFKGDQSKYPRIKVISISELLLTKWGICQFVSWNAPHLLNRLNGYSSAGKNCDLELLSTQEAFRKLEPDIYARFDKDSWPMTDPSPVGYLSVIKASDDSSECTSHILHTF